MKKIITFLLLTIVLVSCGNTEISNNIKVNSIEKLQNAIKDSKAGDNIVLADGTF